MKNSVAILLVIFSFEVFSQEIEGSFSKEIKTKVQLNYILQLPTNQKEKFPLIIFLHGSGERGTDLALVKNHSPFTYKDLIQSPVALLAPQCPSNVWWDTTAVYELIKETISKYNIDATRIYLTGLSMGGWGTWKLATEHPELFAAVAPVCAPVDILMLIDVPKLNMPIRIYHGALDDVVLPEDSILMHQELKKQNKQSELFIFPSDNHNSWDSTYSNPEFYKWLLSQQKK
ncbi:prolyl oligopeptidase family serine peptidase [Flavobacterium sp.]|jgi:predicted peptidase|uniref:carboxylesterase family protein n=1 Tax=Flavobacterium sp. TaxID=239 RepID=UPI0037C125F1